MGRYRNRLQIIADILAITSRGAKKTRIMYQANLSYKLLCKYLDEVVAAGLVRFVDGDCYVLTIKGREFLNRHQEYSKHCEMVEEHLNHINNVKSILERMCSNEVGVKNRDRSYTYDKGDLKRNHEAA
jgi:predicted transcriptional regulator